MQGRGDQRMRKVMTGEQVAQIYNPDPFARPVWRAPVYQTPTGSSRSSSSPGWPPG
jgi:hypothetical protein